MTYTIVHTSTEVHPLPNVGHMAEAVEIERINPSDIKRVSISDLHKHITDYGFISFEETDGEDYVPCDINRVFWHGESQGSFARYNWNCCPSTPIANKINILQNDSRVITINRWVHGTWNGKYSTTKLN